MSGLQSRGRSFTSCVASALRTNCGRITQVNSQLVDELRATGFSLLPNLCSLPEARPIEGAAANTLPKRHAGYTMRYFPTAAGYLLSEPQDTPYRASTRI